MNNEMLIRRYQSALTKNTRKGAERIIQLERENKQLKDLLNKANDEVVSYSNCCIDLQERIDKAIEKLNDNIEYNDSDFESMRFQNDIIEILRGKENER